MSLDLSSSITKIYDLSVVVSSCTQKNNKLCVDFEICILAESAEKGIEYITQTKTVEIKTENSEIASSAFVSSFDYTIVNDKNISVNVMYSYCGYMGKQKEINALSEIECTDDSVSVPALTLYFAKQNEKLWDIAKKFSSDIELIKKRITLPVKVSTATR